MTRKFPHVSSPITIGRTTFRNRIFSAPMGGTDITNDGCIGPKSTAFYELRAKGGAAAVTVSELMVHPQTDGSHAYHLDESILNSLAAATYTADAIRRHGAIPSLELSHSGQFAGTYMTDKSRQHGLCQWSPSEGMRPDGVPVKALTQELIDDIVKAYGHAAGLAKRAGFEMVMIHGRPRLAHQPIPLALVQPSQRPIRRLPGKPRPFRHRSPAIGPRRCRPLFPHRIPHERRRIH